MKILLCVDDTGLHVRGPLKAGTTYTFELDPTCACGAGDRLVCVSEARWTRHFVQTCIACRRPLRTLGFIAYLARRFVQVNDPDARGENVQERKRLEVQS